MRVLWFVNVPPPAMAERVGEAAPLIGGWIEALRAPMAVTEGIDLAVAAPVSGRLEPFTLDSCRYYGIKREPAPPGLRGIIRGWHHDDAPLGGIERCLAIIDEFRPDVIHVHGSESFFGLVAGRTAIPVLVSLQGILTEYRKHYFDGFGRIVAAREALSLEFLKARRRFLAHEYMTMSRAAVREKVILSAAAGVLGRTEWDRTVTAQIAPETKYFDGPEALRAEFFAAHWSGPEHTGRPVVYCTSGPAPYKGLETLVEAAGILAGVEPRVRWRVAGTVRGTSVWSAVHRLTRRVACEADIEWLGPQTAQELIRGLEGAAAFVLPSHIENSPNSLGEAQLVGVPCVAASCGGVPSMIDDGVDGLLFEPGQPAALVTALRRILADTHLAGGLSARGSEVAAARHDAERALELTLAAYRTVVASTGAGSGS